MNETIKTINALMIDFYDHWEKENTNEMFILLNGDNSTREIELNIKKNNERLEIVEEIFNDETKFQDIVDNWNSIDLKMLDSLVETFEIDITPFIEKIKSSNEQKEIKEFFSGR